MFSTENYQEAIDCYVKGLAGMDFSTCCDSDDVSAEQSYMVNVGKKLPMMNNIALCLQNQNKIDATFTMLEKVLDIDKDNTKALCRKMNMLMSQNLTEQADDLVKQMKNNYALYMDQKSEADVELIRSTIIGIEKELKEHKQKAKEFAKNIFASNGSLYEDKPDVEEEVEVSQYDQEW